MLPLLVLHVSVLQYCSWKERVFIFFCVQSTQYNRSEELTLFSYSLYLSNNNHTQTFSYFELFKSQQGGLKWDDFYRSFNACALFKS